jgi:hypothetical protein
VAPRLGPDGGDCGRGIAAERFWALSMLLHVAAAHILGADEFVTTEGTNKAVHRTHLVQVIYLFSLSV